MRRNFWPVIVVCTALSGCGGGSPDPVTPPTAAPRLLLMDDGTTGAELYTLDRLTGTTRLIKDLSPQTRGSDPENAVMLGNRVIFTAKETAHGREPYVTDGATVTMLADTSVGRWGSVNQLVAAGSQVFFMAHDASGHTLWVTGGTTATTRRVMTFSNLFLPVVILGAAGNTVVISQDDGSITTLLRSDGTASGTTPFMSLPSGAHATTPSPTSAGLGGDLYFTISEPGEGITLWRTDGTAGGTTRVFGRNSTSDPYRTVIASSLTHWKNRMLFSEGQSIWMTDGTTTGTQAIDTFNDPHDIQMMATDDAFFYSLSPMSSSAAELWMLHDPTQQPVRISTASQYFTLLGAISSGIVFTNWGTGTATLNFADKSTGALSQTATLTAVVNRQPASMIGVSASRVFLRLENPADAQTLWAADATQLQSVATVKPVNALATLGGDVVFTAVTAETGTEPWISGGSPASTRALADINTRTLDTHFSWPVHSGNHSFFVAGDPDSSQLYVTDGTAAGTIPVTPAAAFSSYSRNILGFPGDAHVGAALNDGLLFARSGLTGNRQLWFSDGTTVGTRKLADPCAPSTPGNANVIALGNVGLAVLDDCNGATLWKTDGNTASAIRTFNTADGDFYGSIQVAGDNAYFTMTSSTGQTLWRTDGTSAGTLALSPAGAHVSRLQVVKYAVYFNNEQSTDDALWFTDGTLSGTHLVKSFVNARIKQLGSANGRAVVLLELFGGNPAPPFWSSDGTAAGTQSFVATGLTGSTTDIGQPWYSTPRGVFFTYVPVNAPKQLWHTDGTTTGTAMVTTFWHVSTRLPGDGCYDNSGVSPSLMGYPDVESTGDELYAIGQGANAMTALWYSNGTAAGSREFLAPPATACSIYGIF